MSGAMARRASAKKVTIACDHSTSVLVLIVCSSLDPLLKLTSLLAAGLLPLDLSNIHRKHTTFSERPPVGWIELLQRLGDTQTNRTGLTCEPPTTDFRPHIELTECCIAERASRKPSYGEFREGTLCKECH